MEPITVIVVDDHQIVREGVRMILENDDQIEVAGVAGKIEDALRLIGSAKPDLILLDIDLENVSSLDYLDKITAASPESRILILTGIIDEEANKRAVLGGARGLVLKSDAAANLLTAIKRVHQGELWFDRSFTARLLAHAKEQKIINNEGKRMINSLTQRELEIVKLITAGLVNNDIAAQMSITEKTVRNSLTTIYSKLSVRNRLELALFASRHGIGNVNSVQSQN